MLLVFGAVLSLLAGGCGGDELDELLIIGPDSPERGPPPQAVKDYVHEQGDGLQGFEIQLTHHLSTITAGDIEYAHYYVLATYEERADGTTREMLEHGVLGLYLSGSRAGSIEYEPRTTTKHYLDRAVRTYSWVPPVKYTPGGVYRLLAGWVSDPETASFTLVFNKGEFEVADASAYPYFVTIMSEVHEWGGDAVQGIEDLRWEEPWVIAYDLQGNRID